MICTLSMYLVVLASSSAFFISWNSNVTGNPVNVCYSVCEVVLS